MIAVIKTGGKQYKVKEGDTVRVEKLPVAEGKPVSFEEVLLIASEDGATAQFGASTLKEAKVEAKVVKQGRAKKILVRKFKAKVRYSRTYGHRQPFTEVQITKIVA